MRKTAKFIPLILVILAIIITACTSDTDEVNNELTNGYINSSNKISSDTRIDFSTYERFRGQLFDLNKLHTLDTESKLEQNNYILNQINEFYNTDIDFDKSLKELDSSEKIFTWLEMNSDFNQNDIKILTNLSSNLTTKSFDDAILILENEISYQNVDSFKFEKYQSLVNSIALIEYQYPGFFTVETIQKRGWKCAWAVAKLALASASVVVACNPPALGATVGTGCYLAATSFIAASASVGMACGDD